jgi:hypothetical protein
MRDYVLYISCARAAAFNEIVHSQAILAFDLLSVFTSNDLSAYLGNLVASQIEGKLLASRDATLNVRTMVRKPTKPLSAWSARVIILSGNFRLFVDGIVLSLPTTTVLQSIRPLSNKILNAFTINHIHQNHSYD